MASRRAELRADPGLWRAALEDAAVGLGEPAVTSLVDFLSLLVHWNRTYNLTGIRKTGQLVPSHILDSLSLLPLLHGDRVLDAGTGAGLPGMVLAIARPRQHFTLLDGNGKKTRFCRHAAAQLGLQNVDVIQCRAEHFAPRARYSTVVSRATFKLAQLVEAADQWLAPGGIVLAMKGAYPESELAALELPAGACEVRQVRVAGLRGQRHVVVLGIGPA